MSDARSNGRRFRFGVRTLLIAMALAALASWAYWDLWPRWELHREQVRFEAAARRLKVGADFEEVRWLRNLPQPQGGNYGYITDKNDDTIGFIVYQWPNRVYLVYSKLQGRQPFTCDSVEVFRAPAAPRGYQPQTQRSREAVARFRPHESIERGASAYWHDLLTVLSGDRREKLGLTYELIHADRPTDSTRPELQK